MTKFFYDLTRSNWGFPWHIILANILATGLLVLFFWLIKGQHTGFYYGLTWLGTNAVGYAYEVYQVKKDPLAKAEFWEDMAANNAGLILACLIHFIAR